MRLLMLHHRDVIISSLFHLVLYSIRQVTPISLNNYNQIIKLSRKYIGVQYPDRTSKEDLDVGFVNCLSHQTNESDTYMKCNSQNACFVGTILTFESVTGSWKKQQQHWGCWPKALTMGINCSSSCLFDTSHENLQFVSFCSCSGSLCNEIDLVYTRLNNLTDCREEISPNLAYTENNPSRSLIVTTAISSATLLFIIACLIVLSCWRQKDKKNTNRTMRLVQPLHEGETEMRKTSQRLSQSVLDDLLHGNLIHLGYQSAIRLGTYGGETVAVKVIPPKCASQFDNEVDIFQVLGDHPNVAKFITYDQMQCKGNGIILLEYYPNGSLLNFIRHHTLTWVQMMKIVQSVVSGLAYLHGNDDDMNDCERRPKICHRDLNSRNILVKMDGTCVLADFGFAVKLVGKPVSKYHIPVGSPRYMAPEVLSQSQLLPDWEASLRKVDIYALGLVIWEVCRSCHELCVLGSNLPKCILPYEEELSTGPSLNKVKYHVCDQMLRPKLADQWDPNNIGLRTLKSIIQECWQHDPQLRPEAHSIFERLEELENMSPTPRSNQETYRKTELNPNLELYYKPREMSYSLNEYMYDDTKDASDPLLYGYVTEDLVSTVAMTVITVPLAVSTVPLIV